MRRKYSRAKSFLLQQMKKNSNFSPTKQQIIKGYKYADKSEIKSTAKLETQNNKQEKQQDQQNFTQKMVQRLSNQQNKDKIISQRIFFSSQSSLHTNEIKVDQLQDKIINLNKPFSNLEDNYQRIQTQDREKILIYQENDGDCQKSSIQNKQDSKDIEIIPSIQPKKPDGIKDNYKKGQKQMIQSLQKLYAKQLVKNKDFIYMLIQNKLLSLNTDAIGKLLIKMNDRINLKGSFFHQMIEEITKICNQLQRYTLAAMTERDRNAYKQIVNGLNHNYNRRAIIVKFKTFNPKGITIEKALKLDLLSYFFKKNYEKQQQYGAKKSPIMGPSVLSKLFQLDRLQVQYYNQIFDKISNWVKFQNESIFNPFVSLFYLIETKHILSNRKMQHIKNEMNMKFRSLKQIAESNPNITNYKYNFSLLVYLSDGNPVSRISPSNIAQLFQIAQQINKIESLAQRSQKNINTKIQFNVQFKDLGKIQQSFKNGNSQIRNKFKNQIALKQKLQKCKWIFLKQNKFHKSLSKIIGSTVFIKQLSAKNNFIAKTLYKMVVERFHLHEKILQAQINVLERYLSIQFIYIHLFHYSYNDLRKYFNIEQPNTQQYPNDQICSLLITSSGGQIYFYCCLREIVNPRNYNKILKALFTQHLQPKLNFIIVMYEFTIEKGCYDWKYYTELRQFFKRTFKSDVYMANSPKMFDIHFKIDYILKCWFRDNDSSIQKAKFYQQTSLKIKRTIRLIQKFKFYDLT